MSKLLPIPSFFDQAKIEGVWPVKYDQRAGDALQWAEQYKVPHASQDRTKVCLMIIDAQNTFCTPGFELVVNGAVEDNRRLCEFIYKNLACITEIACTMDTHRDKQIFHPTFWVNQDGKNPPPMTMITHDDVMKRNWIVNHP